MRTFVTGAVVVFCLVLLSGCNLRGNQPTANQLNEKGVKLLTSAAGDPEQLRLAVAKFEQAVVKDPTLVAAHANRVNALVQLGDHEAALAGAKRVAELRHAPQDQLLGCAIQEVGELVAEDPRGCYEEAALAIRQSSPAGDLDANYVVALKLAESPHFPQAAQRFIRSLESYGEREIYASLLLVDAREDILHSLVPPSPLDH